MLKKQEEYKNYFLGIDTSNYTTSIAIVDEKNNIIDNKSILLEVPKGFRGIRQQEAVFQHNKNLPILFEGLLKKNGLTHTNIKAVCASDKPRDFKCSYMPCFLVGASYGKVLASTLDIPYYRTSHQKGHIVAVREFLQNIPEEYFVIHLSGGTSEILHIIEKEGDFIIKKIGGSLDISFGQLIDRIGVKLGLCFPAGFELDKLAVEEFEKNQLDQLSIDTNKSIKKLDFNLSGIESKLYREIEEEENLVNKKYFYAYKTMRIVSLYINKVIDNINLAFLNKEDNKEKPIILVGGVSESSYLRKTIDGKNIYFGKYSKDNAVGVALIGGKYWQLNQ